MERFGLPHSPSAPVEKSGVLRLWPEVRFGGDGTEPKMKAELNKAQSIKATQASPRDLESSRGDGNFRKDVFTRTVPETSPGLHDEMARASRCCAVGRTWHVSAPVAPESRIRQDKSVEHNLAGEFTERHRSLHLAMREFSCRGDLFFPRKECSRSLMGEASL